MNQERTFKNRIDAGVQLADKLFKYKSNHPLILALPRGGVTVGYEVASKLNAPLDTVVARKIGAPHNREFGVGAIAPGGIVIFDDAAIRYLGIEQENLALIIKEEEKEMKRRISHYRSGEYMRDWHGNFIILIDDGLATGVTARAAIESAKVAFHPKELLFASPICARETATQIRNLVDEVVCVNEVDNLMAVGNLYEDFTQITDEEVIHYLKKVKDRA